MKWIYSDEWTLWCPINEKEALAKYSSGKTTAEAHPHLYKQIPDELAARLNAAINTLEEIQDEISAVLR